MIDEHEVVWDRYRPGPYAGMTLAKARLINEVLNGHLVRVWSFADLEAQKSSYPVHGTDREKQVWKATHPGNHSHRAEGEVGIFIGLALPDTWGDGLMQVFDTKIATGGYERGRVGHGSSRVMGLGVVGELEVLEPDPWHFCDICCCWRPRHLVEPRDPTAWRWAEQEDLESGYYDALVCKDVDCA